MSNRTGEPSFLAVDPGLLHPAAALFRRGRLVAASRVKVPAAWKKECIGERCRLVARAVHDWACSEGLDMTAMMVAWDAEQEGRLEEALQIRDEQGISLIVAEWPQVYRASRSKGNPNDLIGLAGIIGSLAGRLDVPVRTYTPAEWIGQCPKATTGDALESPRGRRVWGALDDTERAAVVVSHDSVDAVGIGLHHLDRLVRRLYPGST